MLLSFLVFKNGCKTERNNTIFVFVFANIFLLYLFYRRRDPWKKRNVEIQKLFKKKKTGFR